MSWKDILKEERIKKGILSNIKDSIVAYLKNRKFKQLTKKYIKTISGDSFGTIRFGNMQGGGEYPPIQGRWPSHYFDRKEWNATGEAMKEHILNAFTEELEEHWEGIWNARYNYIESKVNYVESDPDGS